MIFPRLNFNDHLFLAPVAPHLFLNRHDHQWQELPPNSVELHHDLVVHTAHAHIHDETTKALCVLIGTTPVLQLLLVAPVHLASLIFVATNRKLHITNIDALPAKIADALHAGHVHIVLQLVNTALTVLPLALNALNFGADPATSKQ